MGNKTFLLDKTEECLGEVGELNLGVEYLVMARELIGELNETDDETMKRLGLLVTSCLVHMEGYLNMIETNLNIMKKELG